MNKKIHRWLDEVHYHMNSNYPGVRQTYAVMTMFDYIEEIMEF